MSAHPSSPASRGSLSQALSQRLEPLLSGGPAAPLIAIMPPGSGFDSGVEAAAGPEARVVRVQAHSSQILEFSGAIEASMSGPQIMSNLPRALSILAKTPGGPLVVAVSQAQHAPQSVLQALSILAEEQARDPRLSLIFQASDAHALPNAIADRCLAIDPAAMDAGLADRLAALRKSSHESGAGKRPEGPGAA